MAELPKFFDRAWRLQNLYPITSEQRGLIKMRFTPLQTRMYQYAFKRRFKGMRLIIPKGRKAGVTTFWNTLYLDDTLIHSNTTSAIIAHKKEDVQKFFHAVKQAYHSCPNRISLSDGRIWTKPVASHDNANELRFKEKNSVIYVGLEVRGDTPHNLHISEAAHADDNRIKATLGSVPSVTEGTNITAESTANGVGGWFHDTCTEAAAGVSDFDLMFSPWYEKTTLRRPVPVGWVPGAETKQMAQEVKWRAGVNLDREQLFWWERMRQSMKEMMPQEFPSWLDEAFLASGRLAYNQAILNKIIPQLHENVRVVTVIDPENGNRMHEVRVWKAPKPGRRYVVSLDPSKGGGGDNAAFEVIDVLTLEQVAEFTSNQIPIGDLGVILDNLGRWYNNAVVVPEMNFHGEAILADLKRLGYGNIYTREVVDERTNKRTKKLGFDTTHTMRDAALDELDKMLWEGATKINSAILKAELLTFIINEAGKRVAKEGKTDDAILAYAIALYVARLPASHFGIY